MIGRRIIAKLDAAAAIKAIATKFFAVKIPQSLVDNNYRENTVVYSVSSGEASNSKQQFQGINTMIISIDCVTKTYPELQDLSLAVFNAFNKSNLSQGAGLEVQSCVLSSIGDEGYNDQLEMYVINHTYSVRVIIPQT